MRRLSVVSSLAPIVAFVRAGTFRSCAALLLMLILPGVVAAQTGNQPVIAGDVDHSGVVDAADLGFISDDVLAIGTPHDSDVNRDGVVDSLDYQLVAYLLLGNDIDADDDGLPDTTEATLGTDPNDADSDDDGLSDSEEVDLYNTDPNDSDSDNDGVDDGTEVNTNQTDPNDADSDDDNLSDGDEVTYGTDPNDPDTDGDGVNDGDEVANGDDPNVADVRLRINEIMASNDSGLRDEDNAFVDWIEIYNPDSAALNLEGWHLTDDPDAPAMWTFPNVSIGAGGYLVVYASGKNRTTPNLHTNFQLDRLGEYLALTTPTGAVKDAYAPEFPVQESDISYGLFGGGLQYFNTPTPGAANVAGFLGYAAAPSANHPRGIYDTPLSVVLSSETPGATIRYTTDGTVPTSSSGVVFDTATPIAVNGTTILRAAAFRTGYEPSPAVSITYLYLEDVINQPVLPDGFPSTWGGGSSSNVLIDGDYEMDPEVVNNPAYSNQMRDALTQIPTISLSMPIEDWFSQETGIISNSARNDDEGWTRACSAELFYPDFSQEFAINCGIRVVGGSSPDSNFKTPKHSFRIKFQAEYGPGRLEVDEPLLDGTRATSWNSLVLDARLNMTWYHNFDANQRERALYLRDRYMNEMQNLIEAPSPNSLQAHVYINGVYWGLYCVHERPDDTWAADYYGGDPEEYDVLKHNRNDVISGSNSGYNAMFNLARSGTSSPVVYDQIATQYLDIPAFVDYMLLNYWGGNEDWAHQNWYVARNTQSGMRFRFHSWDAEHTFKSEGQNSTNRDDSYGPTELHHLLSNNAEYSRLVGDRAHKLMSNGGIFTSGPATTLFGELADKIDTAIIAESARWGDHRRDHRPTGNAFLYTKNDFWLPELNRLMTSVIPGRAATVLGQLRNQDLYPDTEAPNFSINGSAQHGGNISEGAALTMNNPNGGGSIYYTLDGSDPRDSGGSTSASAINYGTTPPASLTDTTLVHAAVLNGGNWSALSEAVFQVNTADLSALRITEVMFNPADPAPGYWGNDDFEFIEIKNTGSKTIDLSNVSLDDGIYFTFNDSRYNEPQLLAPGGYIVVVESEVAFRTRYGSAINVAGEYQGDLANSGERITLADPTGAPIVTFNYSDDWFEITDGLGYSLTASNESAAANQWDSMSAWRASSVVNGTPGAGDALNVPPTGAIVISEVLAHSHDAEPDWVELHNTTDAAINISNWWLSDDNGDLDKFIFPAGSSVPANGYLVVYENTSFGAGNPGSPFAFSENGESVYLNSASGGNLTGYSESESFGASETGVSFGRYYKASTDSYNFVSQSAPTPGAANAGPAVGPIVITEIMYQPAGDPDTEYIEFYNISATPVALRDSETGVTWRITDGVEYTFAPGTTIPGNSFFLLVLDAAAFNAAHPGVSVPIFEWNSGRLDNAGERVQIGKPGDLDGFGARQYIRVDRVNYESEAPWPTSPDGGGDALHRITPGNYGNDVANWQAGGPTPGQ